MQIKIKGGVARGDEDLCRTCKWATRREDSNGKETIVCTIFDKQIVTRTVRCTAYLDASRVPVSQMEKIAWIVTPDPKGRIGFRQVKEMSEEEKKKNGIYTYPYGSDDE